MWFILNEMISNGCYLKFKTRSKVTYLIKCGKITTYDGGGGYYVESICYRCSDNNLEGTKRKFFIPDKCRYLEILTKEEFQAELL